MTRVLQAQIFQSLSRKSFHKSVNYNGFQFKQTRRRYNNCIFDCIVANDWQFQNQQINLQIRNISGDGGCMFRALIQGRNYNQHGRFLNDVEETIQAQELRLKIVDQLQLNREFVEPFIIEASFDKYIESMKQRSTWGGEPELSMAPACLLCPVVVYQRLNANSAQLFTMYGMEEFQSQQPVLVLFQGMHYDTLIKQQ
eukprot:TRINITY_DN7097_c0_g2_i1.p2 TRINITY_DN7097_c0_g2~~TRINITY_DN7097_c0_g2_i1.p2  ORF type:complete len:206 (+),score=8.68 TRINITY_DN7097_c0_g2_i1:26-619(+)